MTEEKQEIQEGHEAISFAEFLESTPPSSSTEISDLVKASYYQGGSLAGIYLTRPEIQLHCPDDNCNGTRFFRCTTKGQIDVS